jgi:hypothetical protein
MVFLFHVKVLSQRKNLPQDLAMGAPKNAFRKQLQQL